MYSLTKISLAFAFTTALLAAPGAGAYELNQHNGCTKVRWEFNPTFRLNTLSFNTVAKRESMYDPAAAIGQVGDQYFSIGFNLYSGSVSLGNGHHDLFAAPLANWNLQNFGGLTRIKYRWPTCYFKEIDVVFDSDDLWAVGVPADYGLDYWTTGYLEGPNGSKFLRMTSLHEFLHVAGLEHETNSWAIMNYGNYPWRNTERRYQMSPLPDDRRGLRRIYMANGSEQNVAILTTYINPNDVSVNGVPRGNELCRASGGDGFSAGIFDPSCGVPKKLTACPGDLIYARFAIANDSTVGVTVDKHLYFSTDPILSWNDTMSYSTSSRSLDAGKDFRDWATFTVPQGVFPGQSYYLIAALESDLPMDESSTDNWIPTNRELIKISNNCP